MKYPEPSMTKTFRVRIMHILIVVVMIILHMVRGYLTTVKPKIPHAFHS